MWSRLCGFNLRLSLNHSFHVVTITDISKKYQPDRTDVAPSNGSVQYKRRHLTDINDTGDKESSGDRLLAFTGNIVTGNSFVNSSIINII